MTRRDGGHGGDGRHGGHVVEWRAMPPTRAKPRQPQQRRSQLTRDRILSAAESLLERAEFADLTMEQIAEQAHASVATVYQHLSSKQNLLTLLLARLQDRLDVDWRATAPAADLRARVATLMKMQTALHGTRARLVRACAQPGGVAADLTPHELQRARERLVQVHQWLLECRTEIRHPDPELAVKLGVYFSLRALQSAQLLDGMPAGLTPEAVADEAGRMLVAYLTLPP